MEQIESGVWAKLADMLSRIPNDNVAEQNTARAEFARRVDGGIVGPSDIEAAISAFAKKEESL